MTLEYFLHKATMSLEDLGGEVWLGVHLIKLTENSHSLDIYLFVVYLLLIVEVGKTNLINFKQ